MALNIFSRRQAPAVPTASPPATAGARPKSASVKVDFEPAETVRLEADPLHRCLQLGRYGHVAAHPQQFQKHKDLPLALETALECIDGRFALVPDGYVSLPQTLNDTPGCPEIDVEVPAFLLGRHTVTNADFQMFVDDSAYEQLDLWPQDIWPHLIDFKDQTEQSGPRFWRKGRHDRRLADHPVVGVCYYEAAAYCAWGGYRLPSEAEWQMAASWHLRSAANVLRRYPWGDAMDKTRCNIWATGLAKTAPVDAFDSGAAPNGVLQLVGNVWEWTGSDFVVSDDEGREVIGEMLMKCIRGGAFDTYFPAQATSMFRTGASCLSRTHNMGFRCALDTRVTERSGR